VCEILGKVKVLLNSLKIPYLGIGMASRYYHVSRSSRAVQKTGEGGRSGALEDENCCVVAEESGMGVEVTGGKKLVVEGGVEVVEGSVEVVEDGVMVKAGISFLKGGKNFEREDRPMWRGGGG